MTELPQAIPDAAVLLALEPEELGGKLLFLLRNRSFPNKGMFLPPQLNEELWKNVNTPFSTPYPQSLRDQIGIALIEAWAWLEAQGLIVPAPEYNGVNGWKILSRRATRFENHDAFAMFVKGRTLPKELLHSKIADKVWMAYMRGEFDVAVFQAMKSVEVYVRHAAGLSNAWIGAPLMREAFAVEKGVLTDTSAERGEQVSRMELFAGAIGSYKNPHSHRDVDLNDPEEAMEVIMLANHLLRIVDTRVADKPESPTT